MGFDINGFKNAFFSAMRNADNLETKDSQINTKNEVKEAKNIQSAFKNQLANISDPICDSFIKSNKTQAKGEFDKISVKDLMACLEKDTNFDKLNAYLGKTVSVETTSALANLGKVKTPKEIKEMAKISDADTDAVNFHTDMAYATGRNIDIDNQTKSTEEGINLLGSTKIYDAFMGALYAMA